MRIEAEDRPRRVMIVVEAHVLPPWLVDEVASCVA